jgi:hypothetical protein
MNARAGHLGAKDLSRVSKLVWGETWDVTNLDLSQRNEQIIKYGVPGITPLGITPLARNTIPVLRKRE